MNVRRPRPATPRPAPAPAALSLRSSTAGWYAEWKARKLPAAAAEPGRATATADDPAAALAKWLTGGS